ncbi:hypothetical protein LTR34_003622 [Exophiala xenobiotica]|uniref:DUF3835 domain-containing protein n=1 Tax=Vermiconidia calcicola TaxID=1690605 RepID=A0AAV9QIM1_9PEZI|nr:hypothetical protein LTR34_003622 [Exophiala xenobiotica]KAK5542342.1 hypothetical protein LTR25_002227 [Vermiconidia calcicola]KAK5546200.1 hypothetical protein LTR23_003651 [Chaetothyriales sp. CCFEE 6169]
MDSQRNHSRGGRSEVQKLVKKISAQRRGRPPRSLIRAMDESALARIEQQRTELEANITKLRKSLRHWQTLEIDYESLKEEFFGLPEDSTAEECFEAARSAKPELVDENELKTLLRGKNGHSCRPTQLVDLLSKRVEYVERNVQTVRKQLSDAEKRRNALLLAEEPDHRDDAGLPLADITEELDEAGKVLSSKVETPGSNAPQLIDVLKQAGVTDLEENKGTITKVAPLTDGEADEVRKPAPSPSNTRELPQSVASNESPSMPTNPSDTEEEARLRREMFEYSRGIDEVGAIVAELDLGEEGSDVSYDERDDAFELDSEIEDDEDFEEDESEDDIGKSKSPLTMPRGYRKKMEELQEKLGLKNVGPETEADAAVLEHPPRPAAAEAARKAALARHEQSAKSSLKSAVKPTNESEPASKRKSGKKVAFSSELDISTPKPTSTAAPPTQPPSEKETRKSKAKPIIESIVERTIIADEVPAPAPAPPAPNKPSRFKATRHSQPQTPMFARPMTLPSESSEQKQDHSPSPASRSSIISADLLERPSPNTTQAPDADDFPDEAHEREIAMEYQRHRMKRIHAQEGGFVGDGEEDNYGEMITPGKGRAHEDPTGRKVSRFKAARASR